MVHLPLPDGVHQIEHGDFRNVAGNLPHVIDGDAPAISHERRQLGDFRVQFSKGAPHHRHQGLRRLRSDRLAGRLHLGAHPAGQLPRIHPPAGDDPADALEDREQPAPLVQLLRQQDDHRRRRPLSEVGRERVLVRRPQALPSADDHRPPVAEERERLAPGDDLLHRRVGGVQDVEVEVALRRREGAVEELSQGLLRQPLLFAEQQVHGGGGPRRPPPRRAGGRGTPSFGNGQRAVPPRRDDAGTGRG